MKVVLKQDVKNLGKKDEMHEVSDGYARNFLLPRGLAVAADANALNEVKAKEDARRHKEDAERAGAEALAAKLEGITVVVHAKAGQGGRLFGAVTVKDIAEALAKQDLHVDKRKLAIAEKEIKSFGSYEIEAKIAKGVGAKFTCRVEE